MFLPLLRFFCSSCGNSFLSTGAHSFPENHLRCSGDLKLAFSCHADFPISYHGSGCDLKKKKKKIEQLKVILDSTKFLEKTVYMLFIYNCLSITVYILSTSAQTHVSQKSPQADVHIHKQIKKKTKRVPSMSGKFQMASSIDSDQATRI